MKRIMILLCALAIVGIVYASYTPFHQSTYGGIQAIQGDWIWLGDGAIWDWSDGAKLISVATNDGSALTVADTTTNAAYFVIDTSTGTENVALGNSVTNPNIDFLGSGMASFGGPIVLTDGELEITAAGGITPIKSFHEIEGSGGNVTITANPQIAAGTEGQILILEGEDDTKKVTINNGNGVHLHGQAVIGDNDVLTLIYDTSDNEWKELSRNFSESEKAWSFASPVGSKGVFYVGGFYIFGGSANDFNPSINLGTANVSYAAHAFVVQAAGASGGTDTVVRVTGTSITDAGVRVDPDTEDLTVDDAGSAGDYYETDKKWIGLVAIEKQTGPDLLMNYGFCKYWDNNNNDFRVIGIEVTGRAGANDTGPNFSLVHHKATGWTYNAGAEPTRPSAVADMNTDHNTEIQFGIGEPIAWKRDNLAETVNGGNGEGTIIEITTDANKSIDLANILLRVRGN